MDWEIDSIMQEAEHSSGLKVAFKLTGGELSQITPFNVPTSMDPTTLCALIRSARETILARQHAKPYNSRYPVQNSTQPPRTEVKIIRRRKLLVKES
ncbi:hypothetical protein HCH_00634 [Hahella chejuensis KCTC 2396]|uniref:Uncharacterized protein n=1 Tax=Hahella chejuensis (strain KCTC 2396) TaxID=349521 RepID=Q2SP89_HAHCH|nr:hypothetical protein [Hahella chejuensis]ABC27535.1 hypothetical protein HCH_00634 [Hahella chejuensis KCTC 2396]